MVILVSSVTPNKRVFDDRSFACGRLAAGEEGGDRPTSTYHALLSSLDPMHAHKPPPEPEAAAPAEQVRDGT